MPAIELTPAQRKDLRGQAHHLDPVVMIGGDGLTPAVEREVDGALNAHGLIKVRMFSDDRAGREAMLEQLAQSLGAAAVQHIGKLLVLWREKADPEPIEKITKSPRPRAASATKASAFARSARAQALATAGNPRQAARKAISSHARAMGHRPRGRQR